MKPTLLLIAVLLLVFSFSVDCKSVADVAEFSDGDEMTKSESSGYEDDDRQLELIVKHLIERFLDKKEHQIRSNEDFDANEAEQLLNRFTRGGFLSKNQKFWKRRTGPRESLKAFW